MAGPDSAPSPAPEDSGAPGRGFWGDEALPSSCGTSEGTATTRVKCGRDVQFSLTEYLGAEKRIWCLCDRKGRKWQMRTLCFCRSGNQTSTAELSKHGNTIGHILNISRRS